MLTEHLEPRTLLAVTIPLPDPSTIQINKIAIQSDDKIILAGSIGATGNQDFFLTRLNADGSLDTTFGSNGFTRTDFGSDDAANDVAVDSQDRIIAVGSGGPKHDFAVARYTKNGQLDPSFAHSGQRLIPFGGDDAAETVAVQSDDKIFLAGGRYMPDRNDRAVPVVRLNANGSFDTTFASTGQELLTIKDNSDELDDYRADIAFDIAITADSKILIAGDYYDTGSTRAFAARLLSNGSLDSSFGQGGSVQYGDDDTDGIAIAETSPGTVVAADIFYSLDYDVGTVFSLTGSGANVTEIGGTTGADVSDILVKPQGRFIVAASEYISRLGDAFENSVSFFSLVSFNAVNSGTATRDPSFGNSGLSETDFSGDQRPNLTGTAIDSDGRIIIAGSLDGQPVVARYTQAGQLDNSFNTTSAFPLGFSTVTGRVFNDKNANGIFDSTDTGIAGFRIFLDQAPFNGQLDPNEFSTPVSSTGTYHFNNLPAGSYRVQEVPRPSWRQTSPALGYVPITLGAGQTAKNITFANTDTALIKGAVFMDANRNGSFDPGESGLANWYVYIDVNHNGSFDKHDLWTQTDAAGNYRFANLAPGTYTVRVQPEPHYKATTRTSYTLTLAAANTSSHKNFGQKRILN